MTTTQESVRDTVVVDSEAPILIHGRNNAGLVPVDKPVCIDVQFRYDRITND
jgi:hypothetical protein